MFKNKIPLEQWVTDFIDWLVSNYRPLFQKMKTPVELTLNGIESALTQVHPLVIILLFCALAWKFKGKMLAFSTAVILLLIGFLGLWEGTMQTLAMVLASVVFCIIVGIPLGIFAARNSKLDKAFRPILDAMQTTPAFVYLVPIVMLFSIGNVAGVIATIVFALPPMIRLTNLGIRQVDRELVEAAQSFGATKSQMLLKVQIPMAMPSILAGLNQTIMMALSMVVIASLIGAGGLGSPVVQGLNTLDIGLAVNGGVGIVLLAIIVDRITQAIAHRK